jgi:hypothetical protein
MRLRNREEYWQDRTARKQHRCESDHGTRCTNRIEPGTRYIVMTLPPNSDIGNPSWWRMKVCLPCAITSNSELVTRLIAGAVSA